MIVTYRKILLALSALSLPVSAAAQRTQPLEPIDLPPAIEQGVDMIYVDPEIAPRLRDQDVAMHQISFEEWAGAPLDLFLPVNPIYTDLRRGLVRYNQRWGGLPEVQVPRGPALKAGSTGDRVARLRERLGLNPGTEFDAALAARVTQFQADHGLKADGVAGNGTIDALNLGHQHYERLIIVNLERARRLPLATERGRYLLVFDPLDGTKEFVKRTGEFTIIVALVLIFIEKENRFVRFHAIQSVLWVLGVVIGGIGTPPPTSHSGLEPIARQSPAARDQPGRADSRRS